MTQSIDLKSPASAVRAGDVAKSFVDARVAARAVDGFPGGTIPSEMTESYGIQDIAIDLYPSEVVGWKVGGVAPALQPKLGVHRLAGAIFARNVWPDAPEGVSVPGIPGGFTAVESEFIARIGADADPAKLDWTVEEAADQIDAIFIGVEIAGSPLSEINDLGPTVVASDFGNNAGVIVGEAVEDWRSRLDDIEVETIIDGVSVGTGGSRSLAGGALESVRFLLEHCARRGRPLTKGTLVSTGAVTGVHRVDIGARAVCDFKGIGQILCTVEEARPKA
ncbi:2-keto-4-pentenoate hydratase [Brevundimonas sp. NPDC092305]|uniref:2-keto-4-pentenoate hydratase n=1 Tax=Brevundimonas sp. NPDC092305 TaxID=3363957 RepID=UPI0038036492